MKKVLEKQENLDIKQQEIIDIDVVDGTGPRRGDQDACVLFM